MQRFILAIVIWLCVSNVFSQAQFCEGVNFCGSYPGIAHYGQFRFSATGINVPDEVAIVDPSAVLPEFMSQKVTVHFSDDFCPDLINWLRDELKLTVLIDDRDLKDAGIDWEQQRFSESAKDQPLYQLLNRFAEDCGGIALQWYVENNILQLTTAERAENHLTFRRHEIPQSLQGFPPEELLTILSEHTTGPWIDRDGLGGELEVVQNSIFALANDQQHQEIAAILKGLESPARQTHVLEPTEHLKIRQKLAEPIDINYAAAPLNEVAQDLSQKLGIDIRLEERILNRVSVAADSKVSLNLPGTPLKVGLKILLQDFGGVVLTYVLRDGVLWITTVDEGDVQMREVVYNVSDFCRHDQGDIEDLTDLIQTFTGGPWFDIDGVGGHLDVVPNPSRLIIRQTERVHMEVQQVIAEIRAVVRDTPPGPDKLDEVVTRYYRMQSEQAKSLAEYIPKAISPESWKTDSNPDGGEIQMLPTGKDVQQKEAVIGTQGNNQQKQVEFLPVDMSILAVKQTRRVHVVIGELINRFQSGDTLFLHDSDAISEVNRFAGPCF